jgi:hypothetical protein
MPFKGKEFITSQGVPHFACSIVTPGDEFIARFIESAVREWQYMGSKYFK